MLHYIYQEGLIEEQRQGSNKRKRERLLGRREVELVLHTQTEVKTHADRR